MNDLTIDHSTVSEAQAGPVVLINTFHPRPGRLDEFIEVQMLEVHRMAIRASAAGWMGSRLHRSHDGRTAVMMTVFESVAAHRRWLATNEFADHVERIEPLLEAADPRYYALVFEAGRV